MSRSRRARSPIRPFPPRADRREPDSEKLGLLVSLSRTILDPGARSAASSELVRVSGAALVAVASRQAIPMMAESVRWKRMRDQEIETPGQLAERWSRDLRELVHQGEISASFARRVMDDMFLPDEEGQPPRLRLSVWRKYVAGLTGDHS